MVCQLISHSHQADNVTQRWDLTKSLFNVSFFFLEAFETVLEEGSLYIYWQQKLILVAVHPWSSLSGFFFKCWLDV